jgi:hypothetical protein
MALGTPSSAVATLTPSSEFDFISSTFTAASSPAAATIAAKADVLSAPATNTTTGRYVADIPAGSAVEAIFVGTNADNEIMNFRVWRWYRLKIGDVEQWIPFCACVGTYTLCSKTGVASGNITDSHFYADTITISNDRGLTPLGTRVNGPITPDNGIVSLFIDGMGANKIEFEIWTNTADTGNVIYRGLASS